MSLSVNQEAVNQEVNTSLTSEEVAGAWILFANTAEQVGSTTKRLEKSAILGQYFTSLADDDLALAARYFAGYAFPLRDQRKINIGGAALLMAIAAVTGASPTHLKERLVVLGDIGDVAAESFSIAQTTQQPRLTLQDVAIAIERLAVLTGSKRKVEWVTTVLGRATPLEAKYLVKLLAGDLRIGLKEGAVEDAIARLADVSVGRVQWVNMLTGDVGKTALLARHQELETARMQLFHPIKFMLASSNEELADVMKQMPDGFVVEDKYDGIRAQVHVAPALEESSSLHGTVQNGTRVALFSRTLDEITQSFPDLVASLAALRQFEADKDQASGLILDGEIVPIQGDRILPFQVLQKRLGRKQLSEELLTATPVALIVYDILYADGKVLVNKPFTSRRVLLESLNLNPPIIQIAGSKLFHDTAAIDEEFTAARARGNEGLMVKDPRSPYKPGRRGRDWLKIKRALATLDVVVTAVEVGSGRRHHVLSDYTFAIRASETDSTLLNIGKAYSGLTDTEIAELSEWFRAHTIQEYAHGKVRTVEPRIVLEVAFDRVQVSKRHKSGYALRFPRIVRVRNDKPVEEIDTLEAVRLLVDPLEELEEVEGDKL